MADVFHNREAEAGLIGCWIMDQRTAACMADMTTGDFSEPVHQRLFNVLRAMQAENVRFSDTAYFMSKATEMGVDDAAQAYADCLAATPFAENYHAYFRQVQSCAQRRSGTRLAQEYAKALADPEQNPEMAFAEFTRKAGNLGGSNTREETLQDALYGLIDEMGARMHGGANKAVLTGFTRLDRFTGGLFPGEMTVLGARPSVGKSAFALNIALNAAKQGKRVLIFSLEMTQNEWLKRALSCKAGIDGHMP